MSNRTVGLLIESDARVASVSPPAAALVVVAASVGVNAFEVQDCAVLLVVGCSAICGCSSSPSTCRVAPVRVVLLAVVVAAVVVVVVVVAAFAAGASAFVVAAIAGAALFPKSLPSLDPIVRRPEGSLPLLQSVVA